VQIPQIRRILRDRLARESDHEDAISRQGIFRNTGYSFL